MLPDVLDLVDYETKKDYLRVLAAIAAADGRLEMEEMQAFESWMAFTGLSEDDKRAMRAEWEYPAQLDAIMDRLNPVGLRLALRDGMIMSATDGNYDPAELAILQHLARRLGLDEPTFHRLFVWVVDYWRHLAMGRWMLGIPMPGDEQLIRSRPQ